MADIPDSPDISQLPSFTRNPLQPTIAQGMSQQPLGPPIQPRSRLKEILQSGLAAMGSAMLKDAGLETPEEKQQRMLENQQRQQHLNNEFEQIQSLAQYRQLQEQIQRQQNEMQIVSPAEAAQNPQMAPFVGQRFSQKDLAALRAKIGVAATTGQFGVQKADVTGQYRVQAAQQRPSAAARDDRFIQLSGVDPKTWTPDDQNFMKGYMKYVDVNKVQPGLERARIFAAPRWAALDPERQAQIAVAKSVAAGAFGNQLTSFNAFIQHLGDFHDAVKGLGNLDATFLNRPLNELARQTGNPKIQEVIAKIEPVRKEFESLLLNNRALYEADRKSADIILNQNSSPAQIEVAVKSLAKTGAIRLGAINSTVKRSIGADIPDLLEPSSGAILNELGADIPDYGQANFGNFGQVFRSPQAPANTRGGKAQRTPQPTQKQSLADPLGIR